MTQRPILFNTEMVKAILSGRKTETRRVIKPQPDNNPLWRTREFGRNFGGHIAIVDPDGVQHNCPYGAVGDELYVRETFAPLSAVRTQDPGSTALRDGAFYKTDYDYKYALNHDDGTEFKGWKPSIHMPKKFSRITLKIKEIRVERVQEITEAGAEAEGIDVDIVDVNGFKVSGTWTDSFHLLWNSINLKRGFGWDSNPWVWVVRFEVVQ